MNTVKIKFLSQQISDAAQAIMALECIGDDSVCEVLLKMNKDNLMKYSEALHEEINSVA